MWPKIINSKWFDRLFSSAIAIICVLLAQSMIAGRETKSKTQLEFERRPTTEQVDIKVNSIKEYVDKQDLNIQNTLQQHIDESNKSNEAMMKYIMSIDGNVKVLLGKK